MRAVQPYAKERLAALSRITVLVRFVTIRMKESKTCKHCGLTLHLKDREGDICLTCLQSLTPHCSFDGGYYSPDAVIKMGVIRQTIAQNENLTDKQEEESL